MTCCLGSPMRADRSKSMIPAQWSPGLTWNAHQLSRQLEGPGRPKTIDWRFFQGALLEGSQVRGLGCAERTASWREWAQHKAVRSDFWILPFTLAMKMMEYPVAYQGAWVAERSPNKAIQGQTFLDYDSKTSWYQNLRRKAID